MPGRRDSAPIPSPTPRSGWSSNRKYALLWPVIVTKKDPLPEAEAMDGKPGKFRCFRKRRAPAASPGIGPAHEVLRVFRTLRRGPARF